jgi:holo-[acyl-carrier protein] synthase
MIYGVGTDIVAVSRIRRILASRHSTRFVDRLLTEAEKASVPDKLMANWIAKRWAGKEAIAKALKTGIGRALSFHDITIANHADGAPYVIFSDSALNVLQTRGIQDVALSLSDEKTYAVAFAVAYQRIR